MEIKFDAAIPVGEINGERIMYKRGLIPNTVFVSGMLVPESTIKNLKKGTKNAAKIPFDDMVDFIEAHKHVLFEPNKKYQIEILTSSGWKGGTEFYGDDYNVHVIDPMSHNGRQYVKVNNVYGVQVIELN